MSVFIIHRTLTRTTGSLTCVCDLLHAHAHIGGTPVYSLIRETFAESAQIWLPGTFGAGAKPCTKTVTQTCGDHARSCLTLLSRAGAVARFAFPSLPKMPQRPALSYFLVMLNPFIANNRAPSKIRREKMLSCPKMRLPRALLHVRVTPKLELKQEAVQRPICKWRTPCQ